MYTTSNLLTLLRAPLAFLFLIDRVDIRISVLCVAMLTDFIDGYLARLYKNETKLGAFLDPLMDKFFVLFVISCLLYSESLKPFEALAIMSRDVSLVIFGFYLLLKGRLKIYNFRSLIWGKITTVLQFFVIFFAILHLEVTVFPYILFVLFAIFALVELFLTLKTNVEKA